MRTTKLVVTATCLLTALFVAALPAKAGDFSPKIEFALSDTKVKANPQMTIHVEQDDDEEELAAVKLTIPKGFILPADEAIANGDRLGTGEIVIQVGPECHPTLGAIPVSAPATLPATLVEQDRSDDQADRGVSAVWVLNIQGVTRITLEVTGSVKAGWTLQGDIPANDFTCPPFSFDLTVDAKSSGGVPIVINPKKPGVKVFSATFTSADSPTEVTITQPIKITK
jgi:hypothetical protein